MNIRRQSASFQFEDDLFPKDAQGITKNCHEVSLLMKIQHTKPLLKNMNIKFYDFNYTVIKKRDEKKL